jgi:tRNA threonylcarbamoyladenosine biosynthesis protein TsaB
LNWDVGQRHSAELLRHLDWLLATTTVPTDRLSGVAVATGPGSFNGLRVALATAKSLALALAIPLYGIPTLDVLAWGSAPAPGPIWAVLEAGRGQVYTACYDGAATAEAWEPRDGYFVLTPAELAGRAAEARDGQVRFCGEWRAETRAALTAALGKRARFASPLQGRRAVWLAELALARAAAARRDDPAALEPLYLRRPAITTSKKAGLLPRATKPASEYPGEYPHGPALGREGASHALRD